MKVFNVYLTEILQREVEIEANDEFEAVEILEQQYNEGEMILDYSDLIDTEFSNCPYSKKEINILYEISEFCKKEGSSCDSCPELHCVLHRIEKIIEDGFVI